MKIKELNGLYETSNVRKGVIRTLTSSDELDSMTMVLTQVKSLQVEPYDIIEFTNEEDDDEYWCVASYERSIVVRESTNLFDYTLNLMDPTKLLENVTLPNMAITNIGQNNTLYYYVKNTFLQYFRNDYGKPNLVSEELETLLNDTAPEYTFSEPTLREYLDFLMENKGYISKLVYTGSAFMLTCQDLNPSVDGFPISKCSTLVQSQTADDYVTELASTMGQVLSPSTRTEYHKLKSLDYVFDSNDAVLILDAPIGELEKVEVVFLGDAGTTSVYLNAEVYFINDEGMLESYLTENRDAYNVVEVSTANYNTASNCHWSGDELFVNINPGVIDITDNVVTEAVYNALDTLDPGSYTGAGLNNKYKNNCMYYSVGNNSIKGLNTFQSKQSFIVKITSQTAVEYAWIDGVHRSNLTDMEGEHYIDEYGQEQEFEAGYYMYGSSITDDAGTHAYCFIIDITDPTLSIGYLGAYNYKTAKFRVTYKPYLSMRTAQRQDSYRHLVTQMNNSTNSKTDIVAFYKQEVEKNNQLGNSTISFYGDVPISDTTNRFKLGHKYTLDDETYYVNKLEYTYKNNLITYKGTLTKNYSNRNINAILNREKRYYSLPQESEAVSRDEVLVTDKSSWPASFFLDSNRGRICVVIYGYGRGSSVAKLGVLPCSLVKIDDNTFIFSVSFYDNVALAFRTSTKTIGSSLPLTEYLPYTDDQGECYYLKFTFTIRDNSESDENVYRYNYSPSMLLGSMTFEFGNTDKTKSTWRKDSREKIGLTIIAK